MIRKNLREQKGIMLSDVTISIFIIVVFAGLITSLMYNIVLEATRTKINSQQIDLATKVFEFIEKSNYNDVNINNIRTYINETYKGDTISVGENISELTTEYKIEVKITPYNSLEGNEDKYDIMKIISLKIQKDLGGKSYYTEMSMLKKASNEEIIDIVNN